MEIIIEKFNPDVHDLSELNYSSIGQNHVFLENGKIIGRANMYIGDKEIYIGTINAEIEGLGYGKRMIESIKKLYNDKDFICGDSTDKARGFWIKMGAILDENYESEFYIPIDCNNKSKPEFIIYNEVK